MCRRLETEEEKVLPFYPSSLAEWEQQKARRVLEEIPNEPLARVRRHCRSPQGMRAVIRPWGSPSLGAWAEWRPQTLTSASPQAMRDYVGLERFWQRFNKVKLEEKALEMAQAALANRNQDLRRLLQQYLAGTATNQKVPKDPHPLLTVKQKLGPQK
ncbi:hypothetical protein IHE44_0010820 [Lamprotornis superbus]|uniref:DRC2 protein n=1 Tax=Lamprotornis superbus TaxID=245042 RepID=A0A835NFS0_9PASS|nr:hypothetical protein IHE44_0010820 [Lamprotornis superbus]